MPNYEGLISNKDNTAIVFDFGRAYTKCGFAGESGPRCIIPTEVRLVKTGKIVSVFSNLQDPTELHEAIVDFIHQIFFRHLLVTPKDRQVIVVESLLTASKFRNTLSAALFKRFEVASIAFATSHVVALLTVGIPSALVLDTGYNESLILPVYEGIPLLSACKTVPVGGRAIHQYLEALLRELSTVTVGKNSNVMLSSLAESLPESSLEDIKVRACFVKFSRVREAHAARDKPGMQALTAPHGFDYPLHGSMILHVKGEIREKACEVLFERDLEESSVAMAILNSLVKCPRDTRKALAENIILCGGTAMQPGFKHRLMCELVDLAQSDRYKDEIGIRSFKFHSPPCKENVVMWLGGALYGALEILTSRSFTREQFLKKQSIPDWCVISQPEESEEDLSASVVSP